MEIAVMTGSPAKGNMKINACHPAKVRRMLLCVLLLVPFCIRAQYALHVIPVDKDSAYIRNRLGIPSSFKNQQAGTEYIYNLIPTLQGKGYVTASADSVIYENNKATLRLYVGALWKW